MYFDYWIGQPAVRPYLARFAAYYYNESLKRGTVGVINYKGNAMRDHSAVLETAEDSDRQGFTEADFSLPGVDGGGEVKAGSGLREAHIISQRDQLSPGARKRNAVKQDLASK